MPLQVPKLSLLAYAVELYSNLLLKRVDITALSLEF
jgi:hypothetical protein